MIIGITLQLFIDATPRSNMSGITACWWDSTDPSQIASPAGKTVGASTDATGTLSLDLSSVSALSVGAPGFLLLYLPDAQSPQEALVFAGVVETSEVVSGIPLGYIAESDASASAAIAVHQAMLAQVAAESTAQDKAQTALDRVATAADRVQTGQDAATAGAQAGIATTQAQSAALSAQTAADMAGAATTKAGEASASADTASTKASEAAASATMAADSATTATGKASEATSAATSAAQSASTATTQSTQAIASATAAAADRVQTGLDRVATAADVVSTHADVVLTHADAAATAADRVQTGQDKAATAADRVQTGLDRVQTGTDAATASAKAALLGSTATVTATGTIALTAESAVYQLINPNGAARDVTLPTLTAGDAGRAFVIKNTGSTGNFLTIKTSSGTQVGPALGNGYTLFVVWSGSVWEAL